MARTNRTRFAVLGMLAIGERSGYDLKKEFERRMSHFWAESVGQIYPTLKKLLEEGLVSARQDPGTGRRARTVYSITSRGQKELRAWLEEPPQAEQVRNEILLKLYFGPEIGVETAMAHLARFEASQRRILELMKGFTTEIEEVSESDEQELFWKITLGSGLHVVQARIAWCCEARSTLEQWLQSRTETEPKAGRRREAS